MKSWAPRPQGASAASAIQNAAIARPARGWGGQEADERSGGAGAPRTRGGSIITRTQLHLVWLEEEGTGLGKLHKVLEMMLTASLSSPGKLNPRQHFGYKEWEEEEGNMYREPDSGRGVAFIHLFIL